MLIRKGRTYTPEEIFAHVGLGKPSIAMLDGDVVKMKSQRYRVFKEKGLKCAKCGIEGKYFCKERHKNTKACTWHLNLYAINDEGNEILMTKDHICPSSLGGRNVFDNYQTMCAPCNNQKGNGLRDLKESLKAEKKKESGRSRLTAEIIMRRMCIGGNLKKWRLMRGMTQEMLATLMRTTRSHVSEWERGKRPMRNKDLKRAVQVLGITMNNLVKGTKRIRKKRSHLHSDYGIPHEHVAVRAYYIWQNRECPEGKSIEIWRTAEAQLIREQLRGGMPKLEKYNVKPKKKKK